MITRHIDVDIMPDVSYFTYQRVVLNKFDFEYQVQVPFIHCFNLKIEITSQVMSHFQFNPIQ